MFFLFVSSKRNKNRNRRNVTCRRDWHSSTIFDGTTNTRRLRVTPRGAQNGRPAFKGGGAEARARIAQYHGASLLKPGNRTNTANRCLSALSDVARNCVRSWRGLAALARNRLLLVAAHLVCCPTCQSLFAE